MRKSSFNGSGAFVLSALIAVGMAAPVRAQVNVTPANPPNSKAKDLEEVEDLPTDSDYLPGEEGGDEDFPGTVDDIKRLQAQELKLSHDEIRGRYDYSLAV